MNASRGLRFDERGVWVIHRRREFGPFDYEWSADLLGVALVCRGVKFGEFCTPDEIHADLDGFRLPKIVAAVASVALGTIVRSVLAGEPEAGRTATVLAELRRFGYDRYAQIAPADSA